MRDYESLARALVDRSLPATTLSHPSGARLEVAPPMSAAIADTWTPSGLLRGNAGLSLLFVHEAVRDHVTAQAALARYLRTALDDCRRNRLLGLDRGLCGVGLVAEVAAAEGAPLEHVRGALFRRVTERVEAVCALDDLWANPPAGLLDLFGGAAGWLIYLSLPGVPRSRAEFRLTERLARVLREGVDTRPWILGGAAHGLTGIALALVAGKRQLSPPVVTALHDYAERMLPTLAANVRPDLRWCQGSLGQIEALWAIGRRIGRPDFVDQAARLASEVARQRLWRDMPVGGMCHGLGGVLLAMQRAHIRTGDGVFEDAITELSEVLLRRSSLDQTYALYPGVDQPSLSEWEPDPSLASGLAGVGLLLLDAATERTGLWSWSFGYTQD